MGDRTEEMVSRVGKKEEDQKSRRMEGTLEKRPGETHRGKERRKGCKERYEKFKGMKKRKWGVGKNQ